PRSAQEVYANLVRKHDSAQSVSAMAQAQTTPAAPLSSGTAFWMQQNFSPKPTVALAYAGNDGGGAFHSLFSSDRNAAVSPYVQNIWGGGLAQSSSDAQTLQRGNSQLPLNLFSFLGRDTPVSNEQATSVKA